MANSIVQNLRGAQRGNYGKLRRALANESSAMSGVFAVPELGRSPDFIFDALTDDAVAFKVWDSNDPLNNSNATVAGETSPAMVFPANTLTPVSAIVLVANDDTIGMIGVRALVIGSATAPTLSAAFSEIVSIRSTFATGVATRVAAGSSPGTTIVKDTTGDYDITFPACSSVDWLGGSLDLGSDDPTDTVVKGMWPRLLNVAGTGKLIFQNTDDGGLEDPGDTMTAYANLRCRFNNGEFLRNTQFQADVADTNLRFGINATPTPDSLKLEVTGITSAELRWSGGIWIGDSQPIAFRTQV
jgi:hypothetical protein